MKTVAVIAEYNPFHDGHRYHFEKIRETFGADTAIVAIMSGNYVQRGDVAIADKQTRAKIAVLSGADLVLELPFPYSLASAEYFATAGVGIADALGIVDVLSFGSEAGDLTTLSALSEKMLSEDYERALELVASDPTKGYAKAHALAAEASGISFTPNNILAVEYLKALARKRSAIKPHTVRRIGACYSDLDPDGKIPSASALRALIREDPEKGLSRIASPAKEALSEALANGEFPCDIERLSPAILSYFRLNGSPAKAFADAGGGLYTRIRNASFGANTLKDLTLLSATKRYTNARIRRAAIFSYFGVTSSEIKEEPGYTQVLAASKTGLSLLKKMKKTARIAILTKPSATKGLSDAARRQKDLSDRADAVFELTRPTPKDGKTALRSTPFVKCEDPAFS